MSRIFNLQLLIYLDIFYYFYNYEQNFMRQMFGLSGKVKQGVFI